MDSTLRFVRWGGSLISLSLGSMQQRPKAEEKGLGDAEVQRRLVTAQVTSQQVQSRAWAQVSTPRP